MKPAAAALFTTALALGSAAQARECHVTVLRPITDDVGNTWKAGTSLPVDIARDGGEGGFYCAHGGSCLPRRVDDREAVRLKGCRIGPSIGGGDHRLTQDAVRR